MMIRESITINADPMEVWAVVADPSLAPGWNPKIVEVETMSAGRPQAGSRYRITYEMSGRRSSFDAEITTFEPPQKLVLELTGGPPPTAGTVREIFELRRSNRGTRVRQSINMSRSGMNLLLRLLLGSLHRIGRPVGKRYLETLKELVEGRNG